MLIELKNDIGISNIMHDINSLYTKVFNSRYNKKGHLFQERFRATLAEKESYMTQLVRHIHLNPKKNGLVQKPEDYPYSSLQQYLSEEKREHPHMQEEVEEVFRQLKGREDVLQSFTENGDPKELRDFNKLLHKKRILGSAAFEDRIKDQIDEAVEEQQKAQAPKKANVLYLVLGSAVIFVLAIGTAYMYNHSRGLRDQYIETIAHYQATLEMLRNQANQALTQDQDVEQYLWKIRLTERAIEELKREKEELMMARQRIEGFTWRIKFDQIRGPKESFLEHDTIFFEGEKLNSVNLKRQGYKSTKYVKRKLTNGNLGWETVQANETGETVQWRGEWDGNTMKGVMSKRSADGTVRDYSFTAVGEKVKR
jgi:hypothetical protein